MVVLTLIFVPLYGAALIRWLKPSADKEMVLRLEPVVFRHPRLLLRQAPAHENFEFGDCGVRLCEIS